jgi:hypothetical protein
MKCRGEFDVTVRGDAAESGIRYDVDLAGTGSETMYFAHEAGMLLGYKSRTEVSGFARNAERDVEIPLTRVILSDAHVTMK